MPELPEVEAVRRGLEAAILRCTVADATLHRRDVVVAQGDPPGGWSRRPRTPQPPLDHPANRSAAATSTSNPPASPRRRVTKDDLLRGAAVTDVLRKGKVIAIRADSGAALVVRLGMTGSLLLRPAGRPLPNSDHVHITWRLTPPTQPRSPSRRSTSSPAVRTSTGGDASASGPLRLVFRDPRRFGGVWLCPTWDHVLEHHFHRLGPDALDITPDQLATALAPRRSPSTAAAQLRPARSIKAALLDQATIAGVGNIYADEALFAARIGPLRPAAELTDDETSRLAHELRRILHAAVRAGGTTIRDYLNTSGDPGGFHEHAVYGRAGLPCIRCGETLQARSVAQRTTVACHACQRWH